MSRSEMALIPCVLPTASQALTTDSVFIGVEVKIFNLFAGAGFQSAVVVFPLTAWYRCQATSCRSLVVYFCSGTSAVDRTTRSCDGRTSLRACRLGSHWLGSRRSGSRAWLACSGGSFPTVVPIGVWPRGLDSTPYGRSKWITAPLLREGGGAWRETFGPAFELCGWECVNQKND